MHRREEGEMNSHCHQTTGEIKKRNTANTCERNLIHRDWQSEMNWLDGLLRRTRDLQRDVLREHRALETCYNHSYYNSFNSLNLQSDTQNSSGYDKSTQYNLHSTQTHAQET